MKVNDIEFEEHKDLDGSLQSKVEEESVAELNGLNEIRGDQFMRLKPYQESLNDKISPQRTSTSNNLIRVK
jgi:hypothetical protein